MQNETAIKIPMNIAMKKLKSNTKKALQVYLAKLNQSRRKFGRCSESSYSRIQETSKG